MTKKSLSQKWLDFYDSIKDTSWPEINTQDDFLALPRAVIEEILFQHFLIDHGQQKDERILRSFKSIGKSDPPANSEYFDLFINQPHDVIYKANAIDVFYNKSLDGGGTDLARRFENIIPKVYPGQTFKNCFEWCSGPGFIGFQLLSSGQCKNLYLADIYPPAIDSIKITVDKNRDLCGDRVFYHHSSAVGHLPQDWKFDLVVANPPFFDTQQEPMINKVVKYNQSSQRGGIDDGWQIHKEFFDNIKSYLTDDAVMLIAESAAGSGPDTFKHMIEDNGMYINDCYWEGEFPDVYYLDIRQRH